VLWAVLPALVCPSVIYYGWGEKKELVWSCSGGISCSFMVLALYLAAGGPGKAPLLLDTGASWHGGICRQVLSQRVRR